MRLLPLAIVVGLFIGIAVPGASKEPGEPLVVLVSDDLEERAADLILETLTRLGEDGEPYTWLAQSWSVGEDGLTWTFYVRDGVVFHDGSRLSADDVVYSLGGLARGAHIYAVDDYTVAVELPQPNPFLPVALSVLPIIPKDSLSDLGEVDYDMLIDKLIGTGPYQIGLWLPTQEIGLSRFSSYWAGDPPYEHVVFRRVVEQTSQELMLQSGEADILLDAVESQIEWAARQGPPLSGLAVPSDKTWALFLNMRREPFSDIRVREAVAHAIDWRIVLDVLFWGYGTPAAGPIAPVYLTNCPSPIERDLDTAADLMQRAGWEREGGVWKKGGEPFTFTITAVDSDLRKRLAEILASELEEFGAVVRVERTFYALFLQDVYQDHDFDAFVGVMSSGLATPSLDVWRSAASSNVVGFSDPSVDHLIDMFNYEMDPLGRRRILDEINERIAATFPAAWLVHPVQPLIGRDEVGFEEVNLWEIVVRGSGALKMRNKQPYLWCVWKTLKCEALSAGCLAAAPAGAVACEAICVKTLGVKCIACVLAAAAGVVALCDSAYDCWVEMVESCSK